MIWFRCGRCGKSHGRGENLSGTIVFCTCGLGNRVPWSSTAPAPAGEAEPVPAVPPALPPSEPSRRPPPPPRHPEERRRPAEGWREPSIPRSMPRSKPLGSDPPEPPTPTPKKAYVPRRIRPEFCLHHDEKPSTSTCEACRQRFCNDCVVTLQGHVLCSPCKNFRLRGLGKPAQATPLSILALVVALASGPLTLCVGMSAFSAQIASEEGSVGLTIVLSLLGLLLPTAGLVLGVVALRQIEKSPYAGGRSLALTGLAASALAAVWSLSVAGLLVIKQVAGG